MSSPLFFFSLPYPPFYTSVYSSLRQTLLLSIQNSFSSISSLIPLPPPPPTNGPPVKVSNFHPPSLSCIPPEGRLSSFPISSPLSLSPLSRSAPSSWFLLSLVCQLTQGKSDTPAQTHALSSFVSAVSSDGGKLRHLPTYAHSFMSDPTSAIRRLGITPDIQGSRSDHRSASQASHHSGETTTWPSFPLLETSLRSDSQWFKTWLITIKSTHKKKYNRITHLKKTSDLKKRHFEGVTSEQLISGTLSNKKTHLNPWKVNSSAAHCDLFAC